MKTLLKFIAIVGFGVIIMWTVYTGRWGWGILAFIGLSVLLSIVDSALGLDSFSSPGEKSAGFVVIGTIPEPKPIMVTEASAKALIAELVSIGQRDATDGPGSSSRFLRQAKPRAREIGEQLNALGGNDYMLVGYEAVRQELGPTAARELEAAWDGVGEWLG